MQSALSSSASVAATPLAGRRLAPRLAAVQPPARAAPPRSAPTSARRPATARGSAGCPATARGSTIVARAASPCICIDCGWLYVPDKQKGVAFESLKSFQ